MAKKSNVDKIRTIAGGKGQKPIRFREGGLHSSTGTPQGQKIPPSKMQGALSGSYGPKAQKQANFARNVLSNRNRRGKG